MNGMRQYNCRTCSMYMRCKCYNDCEIETYCRLQKLEDLIDAGKLIFVEGDDDEMVQIKVARSWLKEMHIYCTKKILIVDKQTFVYYN